MESSNMTYKVGFKFGSSKVCEFPVMQFIMQEHFVEVYNRYCDIANNGAIDEVNRLHKELYPDFDGHDPEQYSEYNRFYAKYMNDNVITEINKSKSVVIGEIMEFYINEDGEFTGRLKSDKNATINVYLYQ